MDLLLACLVINLNPQLFAKLTALKAVTDNAQNLNLLQFLIERRNGAMVRALASQQCYRVQFPDLPKYVG